MTAPKKTEPVTDEVLASMPAPNPNWEKQNDRFFRADARSKAVEKAVELAKMRSATEDPETIRERLKQDMAMFYSYLTTDVPPVA